MAEWFRQGLKSVEELIGKNTHVSCPRLIQLFPNEGTKRFVVLDADAGMVGKVHRRKILDGTWIVVPCNDQPWAPGTCEFCRTGTKGKLRALITVYDIDGFTASNGREFRYLKRLLLADDHTEGGASSCLDFFSRVMKHHGRLRGLYYEASQSTDRHGAVGDRFKGKSMMDLDDPAVVAKLVEKWGLRGAEDLRSFAYSRFVRPMTNEAMAGLLAARRPKHPEEDPGVPIDNAGPTGADPTVEEALRNF